MKNLYISTRGAIQLNENNIPEFYDSERTGIESVYTIKEDTHIVYDRTNKHVELDAKAGDILVVFYNSIFENPVILIDSKEWVDNLENYKKEEQRRREEWASKKISSEA